MTTLDAMMNHDFDPRMINKYLLKGRRQRALAVGEALRRAYHKLSGSGLAVAKVLASIALFGIAIYFVQ